MKTFLVHGIHAREKDNLDSIKPFLKGEVIDADYGFVSLVRVRLCNGNLGHLLASVTPENSVGIGHSNGCAVLLEAVKKGAKFDKLVFINPALDSDTELPSQVKECLVLANRTDNVVTLSSFLPFHTWGAMGKVGYTGSDKRYITKFTDEWAKGHSGVFEDPEKLTECINLFIESA